MGRVSRALTILAITLAGAFALAPGAAAHALLQSSDPAAGATVGSAPSTIKLVFGETPDPKLSTVTVLDVTGTNHASGSPVTAPGNKLELDVPLGSLADGVYTVSWRTVSAVDGHVAAGSFAFGVGVVVSASSSTGTTTVASPSASLASDVARWLLYVGLVALMGAAFLGLAIDPQPRASVLRMAGFGWLSAAAGTLGVVALQWSDAGGDLAAVLGSSIGIAALERLASIVVVGLLTGLLTGLLPFRRRPPGRLLFGATTAAAAAAMLVDVVNGHAAAGDLATLKVVVQWLHLAGVGIWIGGLAALLLDLRGQPGDEKVRAARRYSTWAGVALGVVTVSGTALAVLEIGTVNGLVETDFGRVVLLKSGGLGILALLGATNRSFNIPTVIERLGQLRRIGAAEVAIGAGVLALSALLVNLAPPISSAPAGQGTPPPAPIVVTGSDFGTSVRLRLVVSPGAAGINRFSASVTDFDAGTPVLATSVSLRFSIASTTGVGDSTLDLTPTGPGAFAASGGSLSLDGIWKITATVTSPSGAVEVPLVVATVIPAQPTETNASPGVPTIYTIHLADHRSVQVYLDPGTAGADELHATFFGAAGTELPVPSATMAIDSTGAAALLLQPRQLEPGHFVADVTVPAGNLAVDVVGTDPSGGLIHVHATIQVQP